MNNIKTVKQKIKLAYSPDSDDAFMFYGIASGAVPTGDFIIDPITNDIETLNKEAKENKYDITAISFAAYPSIADSYLLMSCGASFGLGTGPIVLARKNISPQSLAATTIAIPGRMTTAYLLLRLHTPAVKVVEIPFQEIIPALMKGEVDAGLIIHEGQLTYEESGLNKIIDLGQWWYKKTELPLPLGGNAIKRDLGKQKITELTEIIRQSVAYALGNKDDAIKYVLPFADQMSESLVRRYVSMYVNDLSVDCGHSGQQAVKKLFQLAIEAQIIDSGFNPPFM